MRIIKQGVLPEVKEAAMTCRNCGTIFAYTKEDTKRMDDDVVLCPFCKKNNTVPRDVVFSVLDK